MQTGNARLDELLRRQFGHITRRQLLALGFKSHQIDRWIKAGWLIPVYRGVFAVGHRPVVPVARAAGALLACGPGAALSHSSAASLWGFRKGWKLPFEVSTRSRNRPPAIRIHALKLARLDIRIQLGLRVTSPARTILDIAPTLDDRQLTRLVNEARHAQTLRLDDLAELLDRIPSRRLKQFVEKPANPTRSALEDEFLEFCRRFGLPVPEINVRVNGYLVDAYFRAERVIVEMDGYEFHADRRTFESDRDRDAANLAAGELTVRITRYRLRNAPAQEAARLHVILARRRG